MKREAILERLNVWVFPSPDQLKDGFITYFKNAGRIA